MKTFEEYNDNTFDTLSGDGYDTILGAITSNTAQAIAQKDLLREGMYMIHHQEGEYMVLAEKFPDDSYQVQFHVYDWLVEQYKNDLRILHARWDGVSDDDPYKPKYEVAMWMIIKLLVEHGVHPQKDEAAFERVLAEEVPDAWIKKSMMPKRH